MISARNVSVWVYMLSCSFSNTKHVSVSKLRMAYEHQSLLHLNCNIDFYEWSVHLAMLYLVWQVHFSLTLCVCAANMLYFNTHTYIYTILGNSELTNVPRQVTGLYNENQINNPRSKSRHGLWQWVLILSTTFCSLSIR